MPNLIKKIQKEKKNGESKTPTEINYLNESTGRIKYKERKEGEQTIWEEYNDNGQIIRSKNTDTDFDSVFTRNSKGKILTYKDSDGKQYTQDFDENGTQTSYNETGGEAWTAVVTYDSVGGSKVVKTYTAGEKSGQIESLNYNNQREVVSSDSVVDENSITVFDTPFQE